MCFTRGRMNVPSLCLPMHKKAATLIRFCPLLFERDPGDFNLFDLPYHMVWAVATVSKVLVYSTRTTRPMCVASNHHYASLSDLTWKEDGFLMFCSMDGYVSFMIFRRGELGRPLARDCKLLFLGVFRGH